MLRLLTPTDCVKDGLTWYYQDVDRQGLVQAQVGARENDVDIEEISRWSGLGGHSDEFLRRIKEFLFK
jgi:hypothetical protein